MRQGRWILCTRTGSACQFFRQLNQAAPDLAVGRVQWRGREFFKVLFWQQAPIASRGHIPSRSAGCSARASSGQCLRAVRRFAPDSVPLNAQFQYLARAKSQATASRARHAALATHPPKAPTSAPAASGPAARPWCRCCRPRGRNGGRRHEPGCDLVRQSRARWRHGPSAHGIRAPGGNEVAAASVLAQDRHQ